MEFELIQRIRARTRAQAGLRTDVELGMGDDAALLNVPSGRQLVVSTDTLNVGVHFPAETAPFDLGWKALAVNLSDLAAMGAEPAWCTLSLSMPRADSAWLDALLDGLFTLADAHAVALVGGDTTHGPLSLSLTAMGLVTPGRALRRDGAQVDDEIWVTGTLGDAAAALAQLRAGGVADPALRERLDRPQPRLAIGRALVGAAHACIDVSDGLLQDLGHICCASDVAAIVEIDALPASAALSARAWGETLRADQACGGDDYELCFTAPPSARGAITRAAEHESLPISRIGRIVAGTGVRALTSDGTAWLPARAGYEHFS